MRPLAIDLYCGLGGWAEGFLSQGYDVIGFDIIRRPYPAQMVLQDVLTLHGSQFKDAACIVGSSPCQEFSYRAMPFKRCKSLGPPVFGLELFHAQFRIQREASEAAGHHIPMVVENVRGAQPWVGRAAWHYGSYYLWGDVPPIMPYVRKGQKNSGGSWFAINGSGQAGKRNDPRYDTTIREAVKVGGDWFSDPESPSRRSSSKSPAQKAGSAAIAKIPFALAEYIAQVYKPSLAQHSTLC